MDLPNGTGIVYEYDVLNRKTSESYTGTYGSASVNYTLDANGNATTITESIEGTNFTTTQSFDNLDRLTSRDDVYGNNYVFSYDANGNRKTFKDHNNDQTTYSYDKLNRLKTLSHAGLGSFNWSYNTAGLTNTINYPNSASVKYTYDDANRIASIANKKSGADITSHLYEYDDNGNRTQLTESNVNIDQVIGYIYDKADRLTSVIYPNQTTQYILDKVGNRDVEILTGTINNSKTYSYNTRDQLTGITDTLGTNISYTFDDAGNQLTKDDNGITTTFDYTARHRVKSITVGAGNPINYQYDFTGQRVNYQRNGIEKRYLYDGLTLIAQTNTIGNTIARYHYGDRYQLAEQRNSINSYYHVDSLGTNVAVTNQDGSIQARYEYDAYGNLLTQAGSSESPFGFTGYQKDDDTGLYYANARYYDSNTGRFNREDPLAGDVNTPPSLHRYLYGFANPTVYTDPTGLCSITHSDICAWEMMRNDNNSEQIDGIIEAYKAQQPKMSEATMGAITGVGQAVVDAVKGTFELAGQLSETLGEGMTLGHAYQGSASKFRNTLDQIGNTISHPIDSVSAAHQAHNAKVADYEAQEDIFNANKERFRYGSNWASAIFGGASATRSLYKSGFKNTIDDAYVVSDGSGNSISLTSTSATLPNDWRLFIGAKLKNSKDKIGHTTVILQGPNGFQSTVGKWPRMENGTLGFDNVKDSIFGMKGVINNEADDIAGLMSKYAFKGYVIDVNQAKGAWKVIQDQRRGAKQGTLRYKLFTDQCATFGCSVIQGAGLKPPAAGIPKRPRKIYKSIMEEIYENYY